MISMSSCPISPIIRTTRLLVVGRGLGSGRIQVFIGIAVALISTLGTGGGRSFYFIVIIDPGFQAVRFGEHGLSVQPEGIIGQHLTKKILPDWPGHMSAVVLAVFQMNKAVITAHPDPGH